MLRVVIQFCILLSVLLISFDAFAACNLQVVGVPTTQTIQVDSEAIGTTDLTVQISFNVQNTGTSSCYYFFTLDGYTPTTSDYNRYAVITNPFASNALYLQANKQTLHYQVYSQAVTTTNNVVTTLNDAQTAQNVLGAQEILSGQTLPVSFHINVPVVLPDGSENRPDLIAESYDDTIQLILYSNPDASIDFMNDCPTCTEVLDRAILLDFEMTDYATLVIGDAVFSQFNAPSNSEVVLDFGGLSSNESESFAVYVGGRASSGACTVTMSSANGSQLIREAFSPNWPAPAITPSTDIVSYTVSAVGTMGSPTVSSTIDLSTPGAKVTVATSNRFNNLCGDNSQGIMGIDVTITIGTVDTSTLVGGRFKDTITIEAIIGL